MPYEYGQIILVPVAVGHGNIKPPPAVILSPSDQIVCANYEVERTELGRRGTRHPARAALAYLARRRTAATNAELAAVLGVSRAESVPNLTRRFGAWLETDARVREQLRGLEEE